MIEIPCTIPAARKEEIARVVSRCNKLTPDLIMVFYLPPITDVPTRRYTGANPTKQLELIVITKSETTADKLLYHWIIKEATEPTTHPFDHNLLILSENEFIQSFNDLTPFRNRLLTGQTVFDRDGDFLFLRWGRYQSVGANNIRPRYCNP